MKYLLIVLLLQPHLSIGQASLADSLINIISLRETVHFLAQDSLKGRLTGSNGANIAASYIAEKFQSTGLDPIAVDQGYFDHFIADYNRKKVPAKNVVGALPGKLTNDTVIIFSAHYDHIGQEDDLPDNHDYNYQDNIFNGANDNATGVAALLELAKYYKTQNTNRYLLLFVAFSGEEMGMIGSNHLMKKMKPGIVKALINLEMLGRPETDNCFIASFTNKAIRNILNDQLKKNNGDTEKAFFITDPYPAENLSKRSDHYPFAKKIKYAFTIMGSSPVDTYYHTVDDEYETIDFDFLWKATINIALACEHFTK